MRFPGETLLRHCQQPREAPSCPGTGPLTHIPGVLPARAAHTLDSVLTCPSPVRAYAQAQTHTQLPRHTPRLSLPHAAPRVHTHLKLVHLRASFPCALGISLLHRTITGAHLPALSFLLSGSCSSTARPLLVYTYRPVGTLPPSRSLPFPQALNRTQSQCSPLCTRTHASSFSLVHTLSYTGSLSFSSLSFPSACSFTCSQAPKHIYTFKLTLPPPLCVGVHICKKPGNPADAGASAPSPASTTAGPAGNRQLPLGSRSEGGGRRGQRRC